MQYKHSIFELDGVNHPVCATTVIFDNLKYTGTAKALKHLCGNVLLAMLSKSQGMPKEFPYIYRKFHQIFFAAPHPQEPSFMCCHTIYT